MKNLFNVEFSNFELYKWKILCGDFRQEDLKDMLNDNELNLNQKLELLRLVK